MMFRHSLYASYDEQKLPAPRPSLQVQPLTSYSERSKPQTMHATECKQDPYERCPQEFKDLQPVEFAQQNQGAQKENSIEKSLVEHQNRTIDVLDDILIESEEPVVELSDYQVTTDDQLSDSIPELEPIE